MNTQRLVTMANDIAAFFAVDPDQESAAEQVAGHLKKFWEPRMRSEIKRFLEQGGAGLSAVARRGVERL
jgi:formate dehydrogenase subunit delta